MSVNWDEMVPLVDWAASAVARRYGSFTTVDDLRQYGYEWVLAHPGRVEHFRMDDGTLYRSPLAVEMIAHITKAAQRERAQVLGLRLGDQARYTPAMVELVLPGVWDPSYRPPGAEVRISGKADPAESGTWEATVMDVRRAVDTLSTLHRKVLFTRYATGASTWREAGARMSMSRRAANELGVEAVARIADELNGVPEAGGEPRYVPGRHAMTNAAAAAVTSTQWEG